VKPHGAVYLILNDDALDHEPLMDHIENTFPAHTKEKGLSDKETRIITSLTPLNFMKEIKPR
jgi:hypothetical protein